MSHGITTLCTTYHGQKFATNQEFRQEHTSRTWLLSHSSSKFILSIYASFFNCYRFEDDDQPEKDVPQLLNKSTLNKKTVLARSAWDRSVFSTHSDVYHWFFSSHYSDLQVKRCQEFMRRKLGHYDNIDFDLPDDRSLTALHPCRARIRKVWQG